MVGSAKIAAFHAIRRAHSELPQTEREQARDAADKQVEEMLGDQAEKIRENRARRAAERQGLRLVKSRRRDPRAIGYGGYMLVDAYRNAAVHGEIDSPRALTLDEVERYLSGEPDGTETEQRV